MTMKRMKFICLVVFLLLSATSSKAQSGDNKNSKHNDAQVYYDQGLKYYKANQFQQAVGTFKQAIKLKPSDAEIHYYLGEAYLGLEQYKEAIKSYKQAVKLRPGYADAYNNLGLAYLRSGQYAEAVKSFEKVILLEPEYSLAHYNLGAAYLERGNMNGALEQLMILRTIDPQRAYKLNQLLNKTGKPVSNTAFNGKAIALPEPEYSRAAESAKASGTVAVIITIDEAGKVISAHAMRGHQLLREAALKAALKSRFTPVMVNGRATKVTGIIDYEFKSGEKPHPKLPSFVLHF